MLHFPLLPIDEWSSILLEFNEDLSEQSTDNSVFFDVWQGVSDHLLVFLSQNPIELVCVVSSESLGENDCKGASALIGL